MTTHEVDEALKLITEYTASYEISSEEAYRTARLCLADALGCALLALNFKKCTTLLGPVVPETIVPNGCRIPGTNFILDPVQGAFTLGTMIRWLDYNDTFLAAEWAHPSDNLGGILAVADRLSREKPGLTVRDVLTSLIKAYEIQGVISLKNSFNRVGFDHVILVKVATAAVVAKLLGGSEKEILSAVSNAFIDVGPLRTYRHAPSTGTRKSWAAGDATSRGVHFALIALKGEMAYPQALSAPKWGLYDVLFDGKPFVFDRLFGSYVVENILFKISFPAEFHAQTAVEAAIKLHPLVKDRLNEIERIEVQTHESAKRIIDKKGPLTNPADRDHCLQYMIAIGLIHGHLKAEHYEEEASIHLQIDFLRAKMHVAENKQYTADYLDPEKRSIANALKVYFKDGTETERVEVDYPLGHRKRRKEGVPLLFDKLKNNLLTQLPKESAEQIIALFQDENKLNQMPVKDFVSLFIPSQVG